MSLARVGWNTFVIDRPNCQSEESYLLQLEMGPVKLKSQLGSDTRRTVGASGVRRGAGMWGCGVWWVRTHASNTTNGETDYGEVNQLDSLNGQGTSLGMSWGSSQNDS